MSNFTLKHYSYVAMLLFVGYGLIYPDSTNAKPRTLNAADSIAYKAFNHNGALFISKSNTEIFPTIRLYSSELSSRASQILADQEAFYVYGDCNEGNGFVIVSADDRMPEVLAYSYEEPFAVENMPASTRYWLECYLDDFISLEAYVPSKASDTPLLQSADLRPEGVAPILGRLPWGQSDPYNALCPLSSGGRCVVGCVATAMSQVMWLHQWPECGKGNIEYDTRTHHIRVKMNLSDYPLPWDLIKEEYSRGKYSEEEAKAVATLAAVCGAAVRMDYAPDGSGAYQEDLLKALVSNFYYDPDAAFLYREYFTSADWHSLLITELNAGRAVNYAGQSRSDGGHSFVIDGYEAGSNPSNPHYHLNWGWNGHCNGYYTLPQLRPSEDGRYYVDEGFSSGQQMLIGVRPDDGQVEANKMLLAEGLKVMQATLKPGEASKLTVNEISNLCYRTFRGTLSVQLSDTMGNTYILGNTKVDEIPYLKSIDKLSIPFVIPDTFAVGNYTVKAIGINEEGNQTVMYSRSAPQLAVSNNPYGDDTSSGITLLCSSEYEVYKLPGNESSINVNVYELYNYSDDLLEGDLQLEIASDDGTSLMSIGSSIWYPSFESQEVASIPVALLGSVPDTLSNGQYRLYVLFYPRGIYMPTRVKFYDRVDPSAVPADYYLPMVVKDNEIIVNGVSFSKTTSHIACPISSHVESALSVFSILGIKQKNIRNGINIVKKSDGRMSKMIIK